MTKGTLGGIFAIVGMLVSRGCNTAGSDHGAPAAAPSADDKTTTVPGAGADNTVGEVGDAQERFHALEP